MKGVTTDVSSLYPEPLATIFPSVSHQICEFHVLAELTKAVLRAVAKVRRTLKAAAPKLPKGRPATQKAKREARRKKRLTQKAADLFEYRHLFVQKSLTPKEGRSLARITRGCRTSRHCEPSWTRSTVSLTGAAVRLPRWPNWRGFELVSGASSTLGKPCKNSLAPRGKRR